MRGKKYGENSIFKRREKKKYKRITLEKLLEGLSYRKIASYMGVSVDVVRRYTKRIDTRAEELLKNK